LLTACSSTIRLYEGPPRAPEDIATINVKVDGSQFGKYVLELYDGMPIDRSLKQGYIIELEPGLHTLWLHGRKKRPPLDVYMPRVNINSRAGALLWAATAAGVNAVYVPYQMIRPMPSSPATNVSFDADPGRAYTLQATGSFDNPRFRIVEIKSPAESDTYQPEVLAQAP
jgi:hypothetical protein